MAADESYQPKVHMEQGGDVLRVASGGTIAVDAGGGLTRAEQIIMNVGAKVGATAGWSVAPAADTFLWTCPASQTASTLVVPVTGLKIGDTVTGFAVLGQIESAGGAVTLDAALRKHTTAAADVSDASVGAITQVSVTADTALSSSNAGKTGLTEVLAEGETLYVLLTATTAGSTDIALQGLLINVTRA